MSKKGKVSGKTDDVMNPSPKNLGFWVAQHKEGRLIHALRAYPEEASRFFGAIPVLRENMSELSLILEAYKTIKKSNEQLNRTHNQFCERVFEYMKSQDPDFSIEPSSKLPVFGKNYAPTLRERAKRLIFLAKGLKK